MTAVPLPRSDEIVLGGETIDRLGVRVGDNVDVDTGEGAQPMRLTGRGVFPQMGQGSFSTTGLGVGAQLGGGSLASFGDFENVPRDYELDGRRYNFVAIDVDGSPAGLDAELTELEALTVADGAFAFVRHEQPPRKIRDLDRVRVVPSAMAGVLALIAVATLAHLLVTSVHERRRELALLRTLGFSGQQLRATVSWHASVVAVTALAVGAPLGIVLGRAIWRWFAVGLDASAPAETPWMWLVVVVVATAGTLPTWWPPSPDARLRGHARPSSCVTRSLENVSIPEVHPFIAPEPCLLNARDQYPRLIAEVGGRSDRCASRIHDVPDIARALAVDITGRCVLREVVEGPSVVRHLLGAVIWTSSRAKQRRVGSLTGDRGSEQSRPCLEAATVQVLAPCLSGMNM